MVKLTSVGPSQHVITVPQELRRAMGWEEGMELEFSVVDEETLELSEK